MYKKILLLFYCFNPLFSKEKVETYLFQENFKPTITTIFDNNNTHQHKVIIKKKDPIIKPTKMKRSILLMITDKAVGFIKFIWPYLYPIGLALGLILIMKLNNGSLTGTEIKNLLYYYPPKKN